MGRRIPIGSVLVFRGQIIGRGHNRRVQGKSAILHGEMDALDDPGRRSAAVYRESAIVCDTFTLRDVLWRDSFNGDPKVVVRENRTFLGEDQFIRSSSVETVVLDDEICEGLMFFFIRKNPTLWNEDIGV